MSTLRSDNVFVGMLVAIFLTVTIFYSLHTMNPHIAMGRCPGECLRERFIATMSVFINIVPFIIYMRAKKDNAMRGVGIITVLMAVFVMMFYYIYGHTSILD